MITISKETALAFVMGAGVALVGYGGHMWSKYGNWHRQAARNRHLSRRQPEIGNNSVSMGTPYQNWSGSARR